MKQIKTYNDFVNEAFNWEADRNRRDKMETAKEELDDLLDRRKQMDIDMEEEAGEKGDDFGDEEGNKWGAEMNKLDKQIEKARAKYEKAKEVYDNEGRRGPRASKELTAEEAATKQLKANLDSVKASIKSYPDRTPKEAAKIFKDRYRLNMDVDSIASALVGMGLLKESENQEVKINGKLVDIDSLEVSGINKKDYPKFTDAYFSKGKFTDGTDMTEDELQKLHDRHYELLFSIISDEIAGEEDFKKDQSKYPF